MFYTFRLRLHVLLSLLPRALHAHDAAKYVFFEAEIITIAGLALIFTCWNRGFYQSL